MRIGRRRIRRGRRAQVSLEYPACHVRNFRFGLLLASWLLANRCNPNLAKGFPTRRRDYPRESRLVAQGRRCGARNGIRSPHPSHRLFDRSTSSRTPRHSDTRKPSRRRLHRQAPRGRPLSLPPQLREPVLPMGPFGPKIGSVAP